MLYALTKIQKPISAFIMILLKSVLILLNINWKQILAGSCRKHSSKEEVTWQGNFFLTKRENGWVEAGAIALSRLASML